MHLAGLAGIQPLGLYLHDCSTLNDGLIGKCLRVVLLCFACFEVGAKLSIAVVIVGYAELCFCLVCVSFVIHCYLVLLSMFTV